MKKTIVIIIMMVVSIGVHAQFSQDNSIMRKVISGYELNGNGYYHKVTDKMVTRWTFYKDGKLTWKKDSWENDHTYCSC